MARKQLTETPEVTQEVNVDVAERLNYLVPSYIANKDKEKEYKDLASAENTEIKELMSAAELSKYETDEGSVTLSERVSEDFVEERLIEYLKEKGIAGDIVKTKEYVDFDALEHAIYHEQITGDNLKGLASCKEKKVTQVLRIKKK